MQDANCGEKMKVAVCSHFGGFQSSYALHVGWHERARILERFGVDFDFLVNEKCKQGLYPHQRNCLPNPSTEKPFEERVGVFTEAYKELLKPYDVVLTADMVYQRRGNFLAYNAAMREACGELKAWWCHWIHSSYVDQDLGAPYPEVLRFRIPPKSFLVYLNSFELPGLAQMYGATPWQCYPVYNPKDARSLMEVDPIVWKISDILNLPTKQVVQVFPVCTTRMDAKGIDGVIHTFAALKRLGQRVALIIANANSKKRPDEMGAKKAKMERLGLREGKDFLWTSDINNHRPIPRKTVVDLFKLSNLFVFASWRETVGNVFQEAKTCGCQLVLNKNLPCLQEMGGRDAIFIDFSYKTPGVRDGMPGDLQQVDYNPTPQQYFDGVAHQIIPRLRDLKEQWFFSLDRIWLDQFEPLLRRAYLASRGEQFLNVQPLKEWTGPVKTPLPWNAYAANAQWGKDMTGAPVVPLEVKKC